MSAPGWLVRLRAMLGRRRDLRYWRRRAARHGARSVLHLGHKPEELEAVTRRQLDLLFPLLRAELDGSERVALDFGCGPGRFTAHLAGLVGSAIGVDPVPELLALAPPAPGVEYRQVRDGRIPVPPASVDLLWISLVLGSITDPGALGEAVAELERVLRPGGLVFLVENTAARGGNRHHIRYRSVAEYQALFPRARLRHLTDYDDLGEPISVMSGRLPGPRP